MMRATQADYSEMPRPFSVDIEMHKACRDGNTDQIARLLLKQPGLVDIQDEKVCNPI